MGKWTPGTLYDGRKFVPIAGTPVQLADPLVFREEVSSVTIMAEKDNTGDITVGSSTVNGALATRRGVYLGPGDSLLVNVTQLHFIFIDALVSSDGVSWLAEAP